LSDAVIHAVPAKLGAKAPSPNAPVLSGTPKAIAELARHLKGIAAALDDLAKELSKT
jgi:hypothetical protein